MVAEKACVVLILFDIENYQTKEAISSEIASSYKLIPVLIPDSISPHSLLLPYHKYSVTE